MAAHVPTADLDPPDDPDRDAVHQALYDRVCESYHAVDDFRMKLLGLLPVATGTGVFLLLNGNTALTDDAKADTSNALLAIGLFGLLFTLGLFAYELFGIKKCHYLIATGRRLEKVIGEPGQFSSRPRELAGVINEPFASAIIYPASMAAWAFLGLALKSAPAAGLLALAVFAGGCIATLYAAARIKEEQEHEDRIFVLVRDGRPMSRDEVNDELQNENSAVPWLDRARTALGRRRDWPRPTVDRLLQQGLLEETKEGRLLLTKEAAFRVMPEPAPAGQPPARGLITT